MPQRHLITILGVALLSVLSFQATEHNPAMRMFQRVFGEINQKYVRKLDEDKLIDAAIDGVVSQLDEYSDYQSPRRSQELQSNLRQQFCGIGVELNVDPLTHLLTVTIPVVGTPAFEAGLLAGDQILEIDGKNTEGFRIEDAVGLIRGKEGVPVTLKVKRVGHDEPLPFKIVRAIIKTQSVHGDTRNSKGEWNFRLEDYPNITYVRIDSFGERTVSELRAALDAQEKNGGIKALVLDLRENPGGLVDTGVEVCNLFVREGVIVVLRGRDGNVSHLFKANGKAPYTDFPMAVILDRNSASASEIVASCLQDHGRAIIVGERSYGKGTVQDVIPLEGEHSLKLTTDHYFGPSGKNINRKDAKDDSDWGVKPNPGFEVVTDEAERVKLLLARQDRERRPNDNPHRSADAQSPMEVPDKALQKGVEYLLKKLDVVTKDAESKPN